MSSKAEGSAVIAEAVVLPAAVAFGAGWLAWQSGKLLIEANRAVDRQIAEKKRQMEKAERYRKMAAISAHDRLVEMCSNILSQLEEKDIYSGILEVEKLKNDLAKICSESLPDDALQIESLTSVGYLKLDGIIRQQQRIAAMTMTDSGTGPNGSISIADLMKELRIIISAMDVQATKGTNIVAIDPEVLERIKLNEQFAAITAQIMEALEKLGSLSDTYGLSNSESTWFHSCFDGVDDRIESLCRANTTNTELKKGIKRLQDSLEQYLLLVPSTEASLRRKAALYRVYVDASKALGEKVLSIKQFNDSLEIENRLKNLQLRADRAKECAKIYRILGPAAYLCYAWDQELKAMGYKVHSREKISEMVGDMPTRAEIDSHELPFYEWSDSDLTQLYSLSSQCNLQVIVHEDGSVSMQTIADTEDDSIANIQRSHCTQLEALHKRLKENWFVMYDYEETESPDVITTISQWKTSEDNAWGEQGRSMKDDLRCREKKKEKNRYIRELKKE